MASSESELKFHEARIDSNLSGCPWGTGTLRMVDACSGFGIKLEFISESGFFMARFIKPEKIFSHPIEQKINDRQKKGIEYARENGHITNRDYQKLCDISRRQSLKDLTELVEKGLFIKEGKGRSVRYLLSPAKWNAQLVPN